MILLHILAVVLLADFVSGFLHWLEDAYAKETTPIIGPLIAAPNILHHRRPRDFLRKNWWQSSWDLLALGLVVLAAAWGLGVLTWHVVLFVALIVNSNQIHKWAHQGPREHGLVVRTLHRLCLLQTPRHHAQHHRGAKNSHYCVITNLLNPILDRIGFWKCLERAVKRLFGIERRVEQPAPARA